LRYLRIYVDDRSASADGDAYLTVYGLYSERAGEWGIKSSGSTGRDYWTTAEIDHVVDYGKYSYVVHWRPNVLGSDMQICRFRVYWQTPPGATYLPMIQDDS
jgi:hypothetical protein